MNSCGSRPVAKFLQQVQTWQMHLLLDYQLLHGRVANRHICTAGMLRMQGFGWAIAKALAEAGAEISLGVWVSQPVA